MTIENQTEALWNVNQTAAHVGVSPKTLYGWVHRRVGPQPVRLVGVLRWDPVRVRQWVEDQYGGT